MWFPIETAKGVVTNGVWEVDFGPFNENRVLEWITLQGPSSSVCTVFLDTILLDTTARGDFNRADYFVGIPIAHGRLLRLVWNVSTGIQPIVSVGMTDGNAFDGYGETPHY